MDLEKTRVEIDKIDKEIVRLFQDRMQLSKEVALSKRKTGKKVYDKQREEEKLNILSAMAENEFNKHGISELFTQIMSISRKSQYSLIDTYSKELFFEKVDKIRINAKKPIVCFGVKGSYTEQAMEEYFGNEYKTLYETSFKDVMEAINSGLADFGVLPIENSSTGGITDIYDLLVDYNNFIIGEHVVKIEHSLLGLKGAKLDNIKKVYSHPQGLLQCAKFFEENQYIQPVEYLSTAAGAIKVKEDGDITQAAITSKRIATYYGLDVLKEALNFDTTNSTRFIIITNKKIFLEKANKVSICFELHHESGTLYNMLSHFIYNNLNMTKIESRPIAGKPWEYRFFVEFLGNLTDSGVKNAINGIKEEASSLKVLGNYVKAKE
jgi:chorismate mutase / prephenate dehydratase